MPKLTAQIIAHNEEDTLPGCLASLAWADEVLVIDSLSTDRTVEVAEAAGARVVRHEFENFAAQLNWGMTQAAGDWILIVDADERVDDELAAAIRRVLAAEPPCEVYNVVRDAFFLGRRMRSSPWSNEAIPRLFRKGALTYRGAVHQTPDVGGRPVGTLPGRLLHHTYRDLEHYFAKMQTYSTLAARDDFRAGKRTSVPHMLTSAAWRFLHNYFIRGEIRDGRLGFLASCLAANYTFVKYAKLWGLRRVAENAKKTSAL